MKQYVDYFKTSIGRHAFPRESTGMMVVNQEMLRDILAELETMQNRIDQLGRRANYSHERILILNHNIEEMDVRLAKLEERLELWESIPQTVMIEEGEAASTDNINPFTPPGPTGKEIHQAFVQWMTRRAKLEEARKP